jgi:hypothetical protein
MIRSMFAATTAAIALGAGVAPVAHAGAWTAGAVAIPGTNGSPAVAISDTKAVTAAAPAAAGGVLVSTRAPYGTWSAPVKLGGSTAAYAVHVAANGNGDVVVGWDDGSQHIAVRPAGQAFLPAVDLPDGATVGAREDSPQIGLDDAGEVITAWIGADRSLRWTAGSPAAPIGTTHSSATGPGASNGVSTFALKTIRQGQTALAYNGDDGGPQTIEALVRLPGSDFTSPQQIVVAGEIPEIPAVTVTALNQAAVAYTAWDGAHRRVELSRTGAPGVFEAATAVSPAGADATQPDLGWVMGSNIQLVWTDITNGANVADTAIAPQGGPLGVVLVHPYEATNGQPVRTFVPPMQHTLTVWTQPDGGLRGVDWVMGDIESRRTWGIIGGPVPSTPLALAGEDAGDGAVAWADPSGDTLVSIWDASPPEIRALDVPATATAGRFVTLSVTGADSLTPLNRYEWDIVDPARRTVPLPPGTGAVVPHAFGVAGTYTVVARVYDAAGNGVQASRTITVAPAPAVARPGRTAKARCRVPSLRNLTVTRARAKLKAARCALGRVTTPRKDKHKHGLVIRVQSRRAGARATAGAHVNVTLGVKPKPKKSRKTRG